MLLHIPHSSTAIPTDIRSDFLFSDRELRVEMLRMTDWYTDDLFRGRNGAERVVFPVSRLVCDPERFPDDAREPMSKKGMGAVYTRTSHGKPLRRRLSTAERQAVLERFYVPHHAALTALTRSILDRTKYCLIIDCHSFSSVPLPHEPDQRMDRPDICIGTDAFHTPPWLHTGAVETCRTAGWSVAQNQPFAGSLVPSSFYRKDPRVLSIMVEVNRQLYMNERTGEKSSNFSDCREKVKQLLGGIEDLAREWQG